MFFVNYLESVGDLASVSPECCETSEIFHMTLTCGFYFSGFHAAALVVN